MSADFLAALQKIAPPPVVRGVVIGAEEFRSGFGFYAPSDWLNLIAIYGPGTFSDFLLIPIPQCQNEYLDQAKLDDRAYEVRAALAEWNPYPELDEVFCWGNSTNGDFFYWRDPCAGDYSLVWHDAGLNDWGFSDMTTTEFIFRLQNGGVGDPIDEVFDGDYSQIRFDPAEKVRK